MSFSSAQSSIPYVHSPRSYCRKSRMNSARRPYFSYEARWSSSSESSLLTFLSKLRCTRRAFSLISLWSSRSSCCCRRADRRLFSAFRFFFHKLHTLRGDKIRVRSCGGAANEAEGSSDDTSTTLLLSSLLIVFDQSHPGGVKSVVSNPSIAKHMEDCIEQTCELSIIDDRLLTDCPAMISSNDESERSSTVPISLTLLERTITSDDVELRTI